MGIYMYNVGFGDCFQLTEELFPVGLVVDFGSMSKLNTRFDDIIRHFNDKQPGKLLLSHYHLDHLSGLLYMIKSGCPYQFREILIPDIFSTRGLRRASVLLFLEDLLDSCVLPRRGRGKAYTLLEFVRYLCVHPMKVTLLKRGDLFWKNNKYGTITSSKLCSNDEKCDTCTVLWPDEDRITKYATELLDVIDISSTVIEELTAVAETIRDLVLSLSQGQDDSNQHQDILSTIQTQLDDILNEYDLASTLSNYQTRLKDFAHSVNVVFHNTISNENNFLFTGDVEKKDMGDIAVNPGKKPELNLHCKYKYINKMVMRLIQGSAMKVS